MQLHRHSDKAFNFDRACSSLSADKRGNSMLRLVPPPSSTLSSVETLRREVFDNKWLIERNGYRISMADSLGSRNEASALIKRMYSWRGYATENTVRSSPNQTTFEAFSGKDLVGTITLGLDSQEGLLADRLYKQEISAFRTENRKICELSKLAIDPQYSSKELLASLFNLAYIHGRIIHNATDFFIEINPRHAGYYKRLLGFRQAGEKRTCQRVNAPAVLLHLELDYVDAQVFSLAGSREPKEKSLYTHFLADCEEKKVTHNLRRHITRATAKDLTAVCC